MPTSYDWKYMTQMQVKTILLAGRRQVCKLKKRCTNFKIHNLYASQVARMKDENRQTKFTIGHVTNIS